MFFVACVSHALRLFIAVLWSSAGKGLTTRLLLVMFIVFLLLSHVVSWVGVLDCIISRYLPPFLLYPPLQHVFTLYKV